MAQHILSMPHMHKGNISHNVFVSSCVGGSKAPLGTISAIIYAGTIKTSGES